MWNKENTTWKVEDNLLASDMFERFLERLKTYSKCINAATYSVTNTLEDVYNILKYQHGFFIKLTNIAPDTLSIDGIEYEKGQLYNLLELLTKEEIDGSTELREYLKLDVALIKAANGLLFEDDGVNYDFFVTYEPVIVPIYGTNGTSAIDGTSAIVDEEIIWMDGTNGVYGTNFEDLLIRPDFTDDDWLEQFQTSDIDLGYTQKNVFTSEKAFNNLLRNFHVIDVATTEHVDLFDDDGNPIFYVEITIDGVRIVPNHRILVKNQNDKTQNGVYRFENNICELDDILKEEEDVYYFSAFIKEGDTNKHKEFFLDRNPNGTYPSIDDEKDFEEGNNYVLRNRSSYRLLADHVFNNSDYFTQNEPLVTTDFTNKVDSIKAEGSSGTVFIDVTYKITSDFKAFQELNADGGLTRNIEADNGKLFVNRIEVIEQRAHFVETDGFTSDLFQYGNSGTNSLFIKTLEGHVLDFDMNPNQVYYLSDNATAGRILVHEVLLPASTKHINIKPDSQEIRIINNDDDLIVFYTTSQEIILNKGGIDYPIKSVNNPNALRVTNIAGEVELLWLENNVPNKYCIPLEELENLLLWEKDIDYKLEFFSKTEIDIWKIENENLFLKDTQITNLGTNFNVQVPKVGTDSNRLYDGLDDFSTIPLETMDLIKNGNGSFTVDFRINPNNLRVNQPIFYFGDTSELIRFNFRLFNFSFQLPPKNYITFYVNDTDDFPYFVIAQGGKELIIKSNKKLQIGTETAVSFSWNYTTNKAQGTLYFDGIAVGNILDQRIDIVGSDNLPLDIRLINYERTFLGRSEFTTSPLYEGTLAEFRLWDTFMNPSQVFTRHDKSIVNTDLLYPNLKSYWKLDDFNSIHIDEIFGNNGIFFGGLNLDETLREIRTPQQIQLNDTNLYILDKNSQDQFTSGYGAGEYDIFETEPSEDISTTDPFDSNNDVIFLSQPDNEFGPSILQQIRPGDSINTNIDVLQQESTSGTSGGLVLEIRNLNGDILIQLGNYPTTESFRSDTITFNTWETLSHNYVVPSDLTTDGTNAVDIDDIYVEVFPWVASNRLDSYFDNFYLEINRVLPKSEIYKIILANEKVEQMYSTLDDIKSIYLENDNLYFLENNNVKLIDSITFNTTDVYLDGTNFVADNIDFTVVSASPYLLRDDFNIHDLNENIIYTSTFTDIDLIYGTRQVDVDKLNIYWKQTDESINILSDDYSNTTSGLTDLEYIATYPFVSNSSVELAYIDGTNSIVDQITIVDTRVLSNNIDLDIDNKFWSINLKEVFGVYLRNDRLLVGVKTINNEIQVWMYDPIEKSYIRFTDDNINPTLFISSKNVDMSYYTIGLAEYLTFIDSDDDRLIWFEIDFDNKINTKTLSHTLNYDTNNLTKEIVYFDDTKFWLLSESETNDDLFLSTVSNSTSGYGFWKNCIEFEKTTTGWITGESGLLFTDDFENPWEVIFNNIVYKDDFNDVEVAKLDVNRELGFKVKQWSGIGWLAGKNGRIIRTFDNGTNFEVVDSGVLHDLTSLSFIDDRDGLVVGKNNTILSTFSAGDSFLPIKLPDTIGFRSWEKVIYYKPDNAIVVGTNGTIILLNRIGQVWKTSKILNNLKLSELEIQIKNEDLDDKIDLNVVIEFDTDVYNNTIKSIDYLGNDEFLLCGENDLIGHLKLVTKLGYIEPHLKIFETTVKPNWDQIVAYKDIVRNQNRAFVLTDKKIYDFEWDRLVETTETNIYSIDVELIYEHDKTLKHINHWGENYLLSVGERVNVIRHELFELSGTNGSNSNEFYDFTLNLEEQDLKDIFIPKLLFLDYYMGRKINIHLEDGNFEKPTASIPKSLLECFYFRHGESIDFTDYGTVDEQNNYLAYQDWYYTNRRVLDGGVNKWGQVQNPYNKYNKEITAVNNWKEISIWEANACDGIFIDDSTSGGTNGIVCLDNLLDNSDFEKGGLSWTQDTASGDDEWVFVSNQAKVVKSAPFLASSSYVLKQYTLMFKNINHVLTFQVTDTGGGFTLNVWGYKGLVKVLLASKLDPSFNDELQFTPSEDYDSFGISVDYTGILNQTISLDNLNLDKLDSAFRVFNTEVTDPNTYTSGLFEESMITKIQIDPSDITINKNDIIRTTITEFDKTLPLKEGDTLFLRIENSAYDICKTGVVINDMLAFEIFETESVEIESIEALNKTALSIENEISDRVIELVNLEYKERCISKIETLYNYTQHDTLTYDVDKNSSDGIYISDEEKVYLLTVDGSTDVITIIDGKTSYILNTIALTSNFTNLVHNTDNNYLYAAQSLSSSQTIDVIDVATETIVTTINIGANVLGLTYNTENNYIYANTLGGLKVIDGTTVIDTIVNVLGYSDSTNRGFIHTNGKTFVKKIASGYKIQVVQDNVFVQDISVSVTGLVDMIYVESIDRILVTTNSEKVIVIDPISLVVVKTIDILLDSLYLEVVESENKLYVSTSSNIISVVDLNTLEVVKNINLDYAITHIKYNNIENILYVGGNTGETSVINVSDDIVLNVYDPTKTIISKTYIPTGVNGIKKYVLNTDNGHITIAKTLYRDLAIINIDRFYDRGFKYSVGRVIVDDKAIVKEYQPSTQIITLWSLWNDELVEETKNGHLVIQNLNYFNGDLIHLEKVFETHYLGDSYTLRVREEGDIIIDGNINDLTKYYNLETFATFNVFGGTNSTTGPLQEMTYPVKYSEDVVYGPNYNLMTFLQNINSTAFSASYEFDMPNHSFTYNSLKKNGLGEFKEFFITKNQIYIGEELVDVLDYKKGMFIDVVSTTKTLQRVHIDNITVVPYDKYPDKNRYIIHTNYELQSNIDLSGTITLRGRNRLDEISRDLEFTDDLMQPLPNDSTSGHSIELYNNAYFNQTKTASIYSDIILNDDNIRKYVTAVVFVDESGDWNINVNNWKDDPNYFYRPIEIFEVGIDYVLKKAISVDSSNYLIDGDKLNLVDIDFNKFNYRLVDQLTLKELEEKHSWVLNAEMRDAIIGQGTNGEIIWYQGDWLCGIWENGIWYSGRAFDIEWIDGEVFSYKINNNFNLIEVVPDDDVNNTIWFNAIWIQGTWNNGVWFNGDWNTGTKFKGDWYNGTWNDGIWEEGNFFGGEWLGGTWLSGEFSEENAIAIWYNGTWLGGDFANGVWKNGVWDQTNRVASRFGTKASLLHKAIWEYGLWKNGEFHSFLNSDTEGNPIASEIYKNSIWKNGIWIKGNFYGGIWEMGRWENGNWFNGLWKSNLDIEQLRYREKEELDTTSLVEVEFTDKHFYKIVDNRSNYFVILGEPEIIEGEINPNTELLGYNMNPIRHTIVEIIDDTTVLIEIPNEEFPYVNGNATTSSEVCVPNIDPLFIPEDISTGLIGAETLTYVPLFNKIYAAHKTSDSVAVLDINDNSIITISGTAEVEEVFYEDEFLTLYAPNPGGSFVNIIDPVTNLVINTMATGNNPGDMLFVKTLNKGFVANRGTGDITVFDTSNQSIITTIAYSTGSNPRNMVRNNTSRVYVSLKGTNQVGVIDTIINISLATISVGDNPEFIEFEPNTDLVYVSDQLNDTVYVISDLAVINQIIVDGTINEIKYLEETELIYVLTDNGVYVIKNNVLITSFSLGSNIDDIIYYPDCNHLMLSYKDENKVVAHNPNNYTEIVSISISNKPTKMVFSDLSEKIYVINTSENVSIIDDITIIHKYTQELDDLLNCDACKDYTLKILEIDKFVPIPLHTLQYEGNPDVVSHWLDGTFNQGIWENGWFNNGTWTGGIWVDGIFENGTFGG